MLCPFCAAKETKVLDKRESLDVKETRRRRECLKCKKRFTTYERVESTPIMVIKKNRTREQFDRSKLKNGLLKACEKRKVTEKQIDQLIDEVENEIRNLDTAEVKSRIVGNLVMNKLKALDQVAYVRFASVYRSFKDIKSFQVELKNLLK